jgi:hypothetical protein
MACYGKAIISLYVDDVRTSQETQASTACYGDIFTFCTKFCDTRTDGFKDLKGNTHIQHSDFMSLLISFKTESGLKYAKRPP